MSRGNSGGKKGARETAKRGKAQPVGPIGRKEVAQAELRAATAKTPVAKKVTRQVADRLRDVHSGKAPKRVARKQRAAKPGAAASSAGARKGTR